MILEASPVATAAPSVALRQALEALEHWVQAGGPRPQEYGELNRLIHRLGDATRSGELDATALRRELQGWARGPLKGTLQAQALAKPHGYSGDFEIIDAIHTLRLSENPRLRKWDQFFQSQAAPVAVRNRKVWFQHLLNRRISAHSSEQPLRVLNVGSGPGRDVWEWMLAHPSAPILMDCVDLDANAIAFSESLCAPWAQKIRFHHQNVLKGTPGTTYDLVWCAGLFDYLSDRVATRLLRALLATVDPTGSLVVGNFSSYNPSRDYMELIGDWKLIHRTEEQMRDLALGAGAAPAAISVDWEPEGVNLFLSVGRQR